MTTAKALHNFGQLPSFDVHKSINCHNTASTAQTCLLSQILGCIYLFVHVLPIDSSPCLRRHQQL